MSQPRQPRSVPVPPDLLTGIKLTIGLARKEGRFYAWCRSREVSINTVKLVERNGMVSPLIIRRLRRALEQDAAEAGRAPSQEEGAHVE